MIEQAGIWLLMLVSSWSNVGISRVAQVQPMPSPQHAPACQTAAHLSYCRYPGPGPLLVLLTGLGNDMKSWPSTFLQALNRFAGVLTYLQTRQSPAFPPVPLVVLTATDHRAPEAFEQEWRGIQAQTAAQSPFGRQVMAQGSGHDVHNDQPELVIDQIRQLVLQLRQGR